MPSKKIHGSANGQCSLAIAIAAALFSNPANVLAQSAPQESTTTLDQITVTADKRPRNLQDVPISITVVTPEEMTRRGTTTVQDLALTSASLEFTSPVGAPGGGGFIRGIGTNVVGGATAQGSVGIVLDGVSLGKATITDLFDVERVEVLKGPQGTLFGSSVSAGVINITTPTPKIGEFFGYVNGEYAPDGLGSEYTRRIIRAALNLPVNSWSALRLSTAFSGTDGLSHDTVTGEDESMSSKAVRLRYLAELGDNVTFNLIGDYNKIVDDDNSNLTYRSATAGTPLAEALTACGLQVGSDNTDNCQGIPSWTRTRVSGLSGQLDVRLSGMTLTSITSWRKRVESNSQNIVGLDTDIARKYLSACDFVSCTPMVSLQVGTDEDPHVQRNEQFAQELRLASDTDQPLQWVAGLYYQKSKYRQWQPNIVKLHPAGLPLDAEDVVALDTINTADADSTEYAAFGNFDYALTDATRLIGGVRFTHSKVSERASNLANFGTTEVQSASVDDSAATWRAGLQHNFSNGAMGYLTVSTGYKPPQINDASAPLEPIKAEEPTSYELGFKKSLFGNKLYVDADLFYTDVKNYQTQSCTSGLAGIVCANVNVPHVKSKGIEFDVVGRPFAGTTFNLSGIYNVAKYPDGFLGADGLDLGGHQLNFAPKMKLTASLEQEIPLSEHYSLLLGADATARSKQSMYLSPKPEYVQAGATLFNARISLRSYAGWSVSLFGRNLGNKVYPVQFQPTTAFSQGGLWQALNANSRRIVGVQFETSF